jgi:aquaporin Z
MKISKQGILEYVAEFLATALLAFFLYVSPMLAGGIQPFVVAAVYVFIWYTFIPISNVHMNPIVSLGEYLVVLIRQLVAKKFDLKDLYRFLGYIVTQLLAFLAAYPLAAWVRWESVGYQMEKNGYGDTAAVRDQYLTSYVFGNTYLDKFSGITFFLEFFISMVFVFAFLRLVTSQKYKNYIGTMWGLIVFTVVIIASQISGAAFNPWRSLVPALIEGKDALSHLGLYILAPFSGAIVAALLHAGLQWLSVASPKKAVAEAKVVEKKKK